MVRTRYEDLEYRVPSSQRANWFFTICNPTPACYAAIASEQNYTAMVYQREICPLTGTPHIQGYVELSRSARGGAVCRLLGGRAYVYTRLGSQSDVIKYVTKTETRDPDFLAPVKLGTLKAESGESSDAFTSFRLALESEAPILDVSRDHFPFIMKYRASAIWYRQLRTKKRTWIPHVSVYYGLPGSGKTYKANEVLPNAYWLPPPNVKRGPIWFTGYRGEEDIIIDDFYGWIQWSQLLHLLDGYQMQVHVHHGFVPFLGRRIIITSNVHPERWYNFLNSEHMVYQSLFRRINVIQHFTGGPYPEKDHNLLSQ